MLHFSPRDSMATLLELKNVWDNVTFNLQFNLLVTLLEDYSKFNRISKFKEAVYLGLSSRNHEVIPKVQRLRIND